MTATSEDDFENEGYVARRGLLNPDFCRAMIDKVRATRGFDHSLFLTEEEFNRLKPDAYNKNPRPGMNMLDTLEDDARAIETNPEITSLLDRLLGKGWSIFRRKFVCGMPEPLIPDWIADQMRGKPSNNLAHFVRPEFTDITYFYGIDFHQDIVDWRDRDSDFLTMYIYLEEVGEDDAPLHILPGSHRLGASVFPHRLELGSKRGFWRYANDEGSTGEYPHKVLTAETGTVFCWHGCLLHGTQPDRAPRERLSLRYLIEPGTGYEASEMARINAGLDGPIRLSEPREDLNERGLPKVSQNLLFDLQKSYSPAPGAR
jgi:hypothetical protein